MKILLVGLLAGILEIIFLLLIEWRWKYRKSKIERLRDKLHKLDNKKEKIQRQISKEYKKLWEKF